MPEDLSWSLRRRFGSGPDTLWPDEPPDESIRSSGRMTTPFRPAEEPDDSDLCGCWPDCDSLCRGLREPA